MSSLFSRKRSLLALNSETFLLILSIPESVRPSINNYQKSIISSKAKIFRNNREFNLKKEKNMQIPIKTNQLSKPSLDQISHNHELVKVLKIPLIKTTWNPEILTFTILKIWFICWMTLKKTVVNKIRKKAQNSTFLISVSIFKNWCLIICNSSMTRKTVDKFVWIKRMWFKSRICFHLHRKR